MKPPFSLTKKMTDPLDKSAYWKAKRREQKKTKKELRRKQVEEILSQGGDPSQVLRPLRKKKRKEEDIIYHNQRVAIDLQFDNDMTEKESKLMVKQLYHIYGSNNNTENPLKLTLTSFNGPTSDGVRKIGGFEHWYCLKTTPEPYYDFFNKDELVYLTAESDNVLETLDENDVYVIGGLVDHNRLKGLCHKLAIEKNIRTARLPLSEYVDMKTRKVLTVNQVFEILLQKTIEEDWHVVLDKVIPKRKGAKIKKGEVEEEMKNMTLDVKEVNLDEKKIILDEKDSNSESIVSEVNELKEKDISME